MSPTAWDLKVGVPSVARAASAVWNFNDGTRAATIDGPLAAATLESTGLFTFAVVSNLAYATPVLQVSSANTASPANGGLPDRFFGATLNGGAVWRPLQLSMQGARGGSSTPRGVAVRTSADGFAADVDSWNIATQRTSLSTRTIDLTPLGVINGDLTLRIYPFGPTSGATSELDNITLTATVG